jgi:molybdate transport system substrate-binding protein
VPVKDEGYRIIYGSVKAPVAVEAFYPLRAGGEGHEWVLEFGRKLVAAYPTKVRFVAYDFATEKGGEVWQSRGLTCGAFLINGKREVTLKGKKMSFLQSTKTFNWTFAQLKAAVAAEIADPRPVRPPVVKKPAAPAAQTVIHATVPCGLAGPYGEIIHLFRAKHPEIRVTTAANGIVAMLNQLRDGKMQSDVFLALGLRELEDAALKDRLVEGSMVPVATIPLALVVHKSNPAGIKTLADLDSPRVKTIITYSYNLSGGYAAREALQGAELWDRISSKVITPKVPDQCKQMVKMGKGDVAVVYSTCLKESYLPDKPPVIEKDLSIAQMIPNNLYSPVVIGGAVVKGSKNQAAAETFIQFLRSEGAMKVWLKWGFAKMR